MRRNIQLGGSAIGDVLAKAETITSGKVWQIRRSVFLPRTKKTPRGTGAFSQTWTWRA
jgi:hypothetical protein